MRDLTLRPAVAPATVEAVNSRHWGRSSIARHHLKRRLRPAEAGLLERYLHSLTGDVLELGPSGGALTSSLVQQARSFTAVGPNAAMIRHCRHAHARGEFLHQDVRDLDGFGDGQFTAV